MRPCKRDFLRATPEATRTRQNETNDSGLTSGQSPNHPLPALPFSFPLPSQFSTPQEQTQTPNHNDAMSRRFCVFVDVLNGCLTDAEKVDHSRSIVGGWSCSHLNGSSISHIRFIQIPSYALYLGLITTYIAKHIVTYCYTIYLTYTGL